MGYFPLCVNLDGADVILLGDGTAVREKLEILLSFGTKIRLFSETEAPEWRGNPSVQLQHEVFSEDDLEPRPTLVVVADVPQEEKVRVSQLCQSRGIPVNVVDEPALCSFYFPSLVTKGALTVAVSTGGKSPGGAAWLRRHLEQHIPDRTGEILDWAHTLRQRLRTEHPEANRRSVLRQATARAFGENRPLNENEVAAIVQACKEKG